MPDLFTPFTCKSLSLRNRIVMAPQLWHVGAVASRHSSWTPSADYEIPSNSGRLGASLGKIIDDHDITDAFAAFARAAGDDTIKLHGAHGYLIDRFNWDGTNARADPYGGPTIIERSRYAADILRGCRSAVGADFPIIIRISQWKQQDPAHSPGEMQAWLGVLVDAGADILYCSQRRFWEPEFDKDDSDLDLAQVEFVGMAGDFIAAFGGETSKPASMDELLRRLDRGDFDLVGIARALLQDPLWATKVKAGRTQNLEPFRHEALASLS